MIFFVPSGTINSYGSIASIFQPDSAWGNEFDFHISAIQSKRQKAEMSIHRKSYKPGLLLLLLSGLRLSVRQ